MFGELRRAAPHEQIAAMRDPKLAVTPNCRASGRGEARVSRPARRRDHRAVEGGRSAIPNRSRRATPLRNAARRPAGRSGPAKEVTLAFRTARSQRQRIGLFDANRPATAGSGRQPALRNDNIPSKRSFRTSVTPASPAGCPVLRARLTPPEANDLHREARDGRRHCQGPAREASRTGFGDAYYFAMYNQQAVAHSQSESDRGLELVKEMVKRPMSSPRTSRPVVERLGSHTSSARSIQHHLCPGRASATAVRMRRACRSIRSRRLRGGAMSVTGARRQAHQAARRSRPGTGMLMAFSIVSAVRPRACRQGRRLQVAMQDPSCITAAACSSPTRAPAKRAAAAAQQQPARRDLSVQAGRPLIRSDDQPRQLSMAAPVKAGRGEDLIGDPR